jgi:hypothetical protein
MASYLADETVGQRAGVTALAASTSAAPASAVLGAILAVAILLRLLFFVGLAAGDPQDDGVYYGNALALYNEGPRYLDLYRHVRADFLANPIDQFNVRPMVTFPIALLFALVGPGEAAAASWGFVCSLLSVGVVYRLGYVLHGRTVGLVAALLCAIYPLEIINSTRILSDVQVGLFSSLSLLFFVEASRRRRPSICVFSGAAAAAAYLANGRGLLFFVALLGVALVMVGLRRVRPRTPMLMLAGFLAVFSLEAIVYLTFTGDPLLSYHIQSGASRFKYLHEPVSSFSWGPLHIDYTNGAPLEVLRHVFLLDAGPTNQFGYFFYFFSAAVLFSVARRQNLLLATLAVGLFLYLEFGPLGFSVDTSNGEMHYRMVFKQLRFLLMLTAPLMVMAACLLVAIGRKQPVTALILVVGLASTSLTAVAQSRDHYRSGLSDLRAAAAEVQSNPQRPYFGDLWAVLHLKMFTRYQTSNLAILDAGTNLDGVKGACLVLGGSRGVELLAAYVESTLPAFARAVLENGAAPAGWVLVKEIKGEPSPQRQHDLKIYCIPE